MNVLKEVIELRQKESHNSMGHDIAEFIITQHKPKTYKQIKVDTRNLVSNTLCEMINGWLTPFDIKFCTVNSKYYAKYGINLKHEKTGYRILAVLRGEEATEDSKTKRIIIIGLFYDKEKNRLLCFRIK